MALGALIIQEEMHLSDEETIQLIMENSYMQYFIGLKEFTEDPPFTSSMMVHFRRRISADILSEINEMIYQQRGVTTESTDDDPKGGSGGGASEGQTPESGQARKNKGKLMLDATCAPADIRYPTDMGLLNEAREKLEAIIDTLRSDARLGRPTANIPRQGAQELYALYSQSKTRQSIDSQGETSAAWLDPP